LNRYNTLIVEDETYSAEVMIDYVNMTPSLHLLYWANTGEHALNYIKTQQEQMDLILLDIRIPDMTGFEFIEKLEEVPFVIFTTAYDQYAVKAFELDALDYLVKPINFERFSKAIERFIYYKKHSVPFDIYGTIEDMKGKDKYKKSSLPQNKLEEYSQKINDYMEKNEPYIQTEFNLKIMSKDLKIQQYYISQVLSVILKTNFYKFVSSYRIEYAKKLLADNNYKEKNLLEISLLSGFQCRSVFNHTFKEITGTSPKQFRENFSIQAGD